MARTYEQRWTLCTSCDQPIQVDSAAKSVSCPHCNTRVITEAMDVDGYVAVRRFATANAMHITKKGIVFASVRADDLVIDGTFQGEALSMSGIHLGKHARVRADLRASWLSIEDGATLQGDVRVGPDAVPELKNLDASGPPEPEESAH